MVEKHSLDYLREEMRNITNQIIELVHDRMEVAKKIGNIKQQLKIEIEDEKLENDIKKNCPQPNKRYWNGCRIFWKTFKSSSFRIGKITKRSK